MNEVEIVVTSTDRTHFGPIAAKARKQIGTSVKDTMKDVDRTVSTSMKDVGEKLKETGQKAGKEFTTAISESIVNGEKVVTIKTRQVVGQWDRVVTTNMREVGRKGGQILTEELSRNVQWKARDTKIFTAQMRGGFLRGFKGTFSSGGLTPILLTWLLAGIASAAPVAGAALAAGVVTAFGLGLAGIGMFFALEMEKVKGKNRIGTDSIRQEWRRLSKDIGAGFKEISAPFKITWLDLLKTVRDVGKFFKPILKDSFEILGPATSRLIKSLGVAFMELGPAVKPASKAFADLMDALGPQLPGIFKRISDAIIDISKTISANPDLFADLIAGILSLIPLALELTGALAKIFDKVSGFEGTNNPLILFLNIVTPGLILATALINELQNAWNNLFGDGEKKAKVTVDPSGADRGFGTAAAKGRKWSGSRFAATLTVLSLINPAVVAAGVILRNFTRKKYVGRLTAMSLVNPAVAMATALCLRFAKRRYVGRLLALSLVASPVGIAVLLCRRFANGKYRAALRAINQTASAIASALRTARSWAGRVFTATFRAVGDFIAGRETGGIIGGMATGGISGMARGIAHAAAGGVRGNTVMVGEHGPELVQLPFGSRVRSNPDTARMMAGGGGGVFKLEVEWVGGNASDEFMAWLRKNIRIKGGNVQTVLGS